MRKNKKAFTLIELIAVLVILALIALIVTPLVMNIVKRAKQSANERSVDAYGKALELSVASYLLEHKEYPTSLEGLKVEYSGSEVVCNKKILNADGSIYLSECVVAGMEVKDSKEEDGHYHYGKTTGSSSEPTGYQAYSVGDVVTYNGMNFYVIEASDSSKDSVTMLKAEPLTVDEVNTYGVGHVNRYTYQSVGTAKDVEGYGGMAYYASETCKDNGSSSVYEGCTTDYDESEVKYVVDAWANDKINTSDLKEDNLGYKTRLITFEDLTNNLGYPKEYGVTYIGLDKENTPSWVYDNSYSYWTMSAYEDSTNVMWIVYYNSGVSTGSVYGNGSVVRPVITLLKSSI